MSKLKGKIEHYIEASNELGLDLSADLIGKITEDLVPAVYSCLLYTSPSPRD